MAASDISRKLIVLLGPTASGKTAMSLSLAKRFHGEVVSADSRQIYRGLDIGTDKISGVVKESHGKVPLELEGILHFMIDICAPDETYSLAKYQQEAIAIIQDIQNRSNVPFLVGGTGLYISSIVDNYQIPRIAPDQTLRELLEQKSNSALFEELKIEDPSTARQIDPKNKRRLIRALEVLLNSGFSFSSQRRKGPLLFDTLQIGITRDRDEMYQQIEERVDEQIDRGLVEEVRGLLAKYDVSVPALSGLGYKQIIPYLQEKISLKEAVNRLKRDTRRYAKRQLTWFKKDKRIHWVHDVQEAEHLIEAFL